MTAWLQLFRLVRAIGVDVVLPIVRAIHGDDQASAEQKLSDALTARAAGRAAYDASKTAGR